MIMSDYKIETIAEHSFVPSLLAYSGANILDAGCRGFEFAKQLKPYKCKVYCLDADRLDDELYEMIALSDFDGTGYLVKSDDKQATRLQKQPITEYEIHCATLKTISVFYGVEFWDLIKLDIEGSEYEVIMSMEKPYAKQLSIEFHLHTGIYGQNEMTMMEDKLKALGYEFIQHEATERYGAGKNYWDSLFVLK